MNSASRFKGFAVKDKKQFISLIRGWNRVRITPRETERPERPKVRALRP